MAVARRAAEAYEGNRNLAALAVAGSVGAGLADRFSDLELDGYWIGPPTGRDRLARVHALGGELTDLRDYDPEEEEEWSEEYRVGELGVTVSNFLVGSIERFLDDVVLRASTDPVRHMRLAALQRSRPLAGAELMAAWRARADAFPGRLVSPLVEQALAPEVLRGWAAREALVSRGDDLAVSDLLTRAGHAVVRVVLALNRVYLPHWPLKWQRYLITGLGLVPRAARGAPRVAISGPARGGTPGGRGPAGRHRDPGRCALRCRHRLLPQGTVRTPPRDRSAPAGHLSANSERPVMRNQARPAKVISQHA